MAKADIEGISSTKDKTDTTNQQTDTPLDPRITGFVISPLGLKVGFIVGDQVYKTSEIADSNPIGIIDNGMAYLNSVNEKVEEFLGNIKTFQTKYR